MKRHYCALLALAMAAGNVMAQGKPPFPQLGDASGGDCAANYLVYDKVLDARPDARNLRDATPFINDRCNIGDHIRIVADGEAQTLNFVRGKTKEGLSGTRSLYTNERFSLFLEIGRPVYEFLDPETECTERGYLVRATITHAGRKKTINGTLTGGCP